MEFHVYLDRSVPDLAAIDEAIRDVDPAAVLDVDASGSVMRVAAAVNALELVELLGSAGYPIERERVSQLPSICCGGCSG